jgi:hypothetical protein
VSLLKKTTKNIFSYRFQFETNKNYYDYAGIGCACFVLFGIKSLYKIRIIIIATTTNIREKIKTLPVSTIYCGCFSFSSLMGNKNSGVVCIFSFTEYSHLYIGSIPTFTEKSLMTPGVTFFESILNAC